MTPIKRIGAAGFGAYSVRRSTRSMSNEPSLLSINGQKA